jgi:hypothetical protein
VNDLNTAVQWQQVTCRDCTRTYQCTPEDDYYGTGTGNPGPTGGVCFGCLLRREGLDPETTPVLVVDESGTELDPRDLAVRENFEGAQ